jgi:heme-degrading monooxygenase HmoA
MSHVTQITVIAVPAKAQDEALAVMRERAEFMARQPGFVAIHLYRGLDDDRIVNFVEWETRGLLEAAHKSPEFRKEWNRFDELTDSIDPHLYETFAALSGES